MKLPAFFVALTAVASYLMELATGSEALKMLDIGFVFFILPVIVEWIMIGITAICCNLADFIRS